MEHSRFGYSAVNDFKTCPFKYSLNWIQHVEVEEELEANNPLLVGTALHRAIETDFDTAAKEYYQNFNIIDDRHVTEMMKVEVQSRRVKKMIEGSEVLHETKIQDDDFMGTIDLLEDIGSGHFNMYDFKYSNNVDSYQQSPQLTIYKHFYEKTHRRKKIDKMGFIIVPKSNLKQDKGEDIIMYRRRLLSDLKEPFIIPVRFDENKLNDYFKTVEEIKHTDAFPRKRNPFCSWCKYKDLCQMKGDINMVLPSSTRRNVGTPTKRKIWVYGAAMSGKTTMLDKAPNPLNLNTDGNIQFVSMPYVPIKNVVQVEGRMTKTTFAWDVLKDTIAELEKGQNEFKTLIVDLLEDTYEHCRLCMYDKLDITHESDNSFKAWDMVRTEFLSTIKRLMNLDYENIILVSHEDMSKDITKKSGDKITSIRPNLPEKVANKIAGMVDIVARVVVEDDGSRTLNFKSNEVVFGGGRLNNLQKTSIPLDWDELMKVYSTDSGSRQKASDKVTEVSQKKPEPMPEDVVVLPMDEGEDAPFEIEDEPAPTPAPEPVKAEEPKRRTRRTRS